VLSLAPVWASEVRKQVSSGDDTRDSGQRCPDKRIPAGKGPVLMRVKHIRTQTPKLTDEWHYARHGIEALPKPRERGCFALESRNGVDLNVERVRPGNQRLEAWRIMQNEDRIPLLAVERSEKLKHYSFHTPEFAGVDEVRYLLAHELPSGE
jgi:hypothetical protein